MTMMMSKSPQESVNMETFVRSSPSYSSNGRKCIGSKAYILVSQILFNVLWNKHFQLVLRDIRTANHPFSAVTRSVTKIEGVSMFRTRIYFAVNVFNVVYYWEIGKTSLTCRRKRHKNWRSGFFLFGPSVGSLIGFPFIV